jgi:uncharacterized protein (TIGR02231 family)
MEPIEAHSLITKVTLYRNRAAVTRTANITVASGAFSVFFRDLPSSVSIDSVQASVGDNAVLLSVDTSNTPMLKDNRDIIKEINSEIEATEAILNTANAREEALALQVTMLKTLINQASNEHERPVDLDALNQQLEFIGEKMTVLSVEQTNNALEQVELRKKIQTLKQRKQHLSSDRRNQLNAVVDIGVKQAGTIQVQLTYLVSYASWKPTYSIRANNAGNKITIEYDAEITQRTGENWTDVQMTLSTAQPQQSTTPPMPSPWFVDVFEPQDIEAVVELPGNAPRLETKSRVFYSIATADMVDAASASATVNDDGPAVSFSLPRTITVPSNSEDTQTTSLGAFETEADLFHIAVPMFTDSTFIRSNVTNTSDFILLPGRASIFHGSDYVGKTMLPTIAPGETFPLDLGIDPVITATRVLLEKETSSTGLFASGKQTVYEYRITISNGHEEAVDLRVWDRYPVSRNEDIEIGLDSLSDPLSIDQSYVQADLPLGLLRWDLNIPANMTGDSSFVLSWRVEISRGKDIEMTALPE